MVRLTEGRGLRAGSCRMEIGNRLGIDESPIHRGCFYRFIGLVTALDYCPGDLTLFAPRADTFFVLGCSLATLALFGQFRMRK